MKFLGIQFSIGAILDEDHSYAFRQSTSYARSLIVFKWVVVGFLLTTMYKSILLSIMTKIYHEETIDTLDDMLASERRLWVAGDSLLPVLMKYDPRAKVQKLANRITFYNAGRGTREDPGMKKLAEE